MSKSQRIRARDIQDMLRLMNELHELPIHQRIEHTAAGLAQMVDAMVVIWVDTRNLLPDNKPQYIKAVEYGWPSIKQRNAFLAYYAMEPHANDPVLQLLAGKMEQVTTLCRSQLISDADWYRLRHVSEYRKAAGVDHILAAYYRTDKNGRAMGFGMHRAWGDKRDFSRRERLMVHLLHGQMGWLYKQILYSQVHPAPKLSNRQQQVLALLIQGKSEKEAAAHLGLRPHTLHDHVGEIYKKLNVRSRAELMALYIRKPEL